MMNMETMAAILAWPGWIAIFVLLPVLVAIENWIRSKRLEKSRTQEAGDARAQR